MIEVKACPVCGGHELKTMKTYRFERYKRSRSDYTQSRLNILFDYFNTTGDTAEFIVDYCLYCGFIFTNPRFSHDEIVTKYTAIEQLERKSSAIKKDPPECPGEARRIFDLLERYFECPLTGLRVLDYGGANGHNMVPFTPENSCFVLDYLRKKMPPGVTHLGRDLDDLKPGEAFDIIVLNHALEHMTEPVQMMKALADRVTENGAIYVGLPLGALVEWRRLREPITHLNYFSEQSGVVCLERSGLSVVHVSSLYTARSWEVALIGIRKNRKTTAPLTYSSTRRQMLNPLYYPPLVWGKLRRGMGGAVARYGARGFRR